MNDSKILLPAEWAEQSGVMLTWPHEDTDWAEMLDVVEVCFIAIAKAISEMERLLIVCRDSTRLSEKLVDCKIENIIFAEFPSNDTWARDHGAITVMIDEKPVLYDFGFNGWGLKFPANLDNQLTSLLFRRNFFEKQVGYKNMQHLILEGGSFESDGEGTLLTTRECLLSVNRNSYLTEKQIENELMAIFGLHRVLWLSSGYLAGDDTDSHVDTLARFCNPETIAYVKSDNPDDEHHEALSLMEQQLMTFKTLKNLPYQLVPLPMADPVYEKDFRLPATYANFLIINSSVLVPTYKSYKDQVALQQLKKAFPDRQVLGINCLPLIKQHGSLHCVTMQFPKGVI
ncbi:MAG: agmatine deiminase family protein [Mariniphaga sp.]